MGVGDRGSKERRVCKSGEVECSDVAHGSLFTQDASRSPGGLVEVKLAGPPSQSF